MREINGPLHCSACGRVLTEYIRGQEYKGCCERCHTEHHLTVRQPEAGRLLSPLLTNAEDYGKSIVRS